MDRSVTGPASRSRPRAGHPDLLERIERDFNTPPPLSVQRRRRLLAELCHLLAEEFGTTPGDSLEGGMGAGGPIGKNARSSRGRGPNGHAPSAEDRAGPDRLGVSLPPRERQTLGHLLAGDSEKQIACKLRISPHTVHVYVKKLYRRFAVNSRGELLAKWVRG